METYDNIIVGGGIGGLICGGYLASAGQKTIIFESQSTPGGRITSHEFDGYTCTLHGITHHPKMGEEGFWFAAARDLGAKVRLRHVPAGAIVWWRGQGWKYKFKGYKDLDGLLDFASVQSPEPLTEASKREFPKIFQEILNWDYVKMCADLDRVFLIDYLNDRTKNPQVHHCFVNLFSQMICMDYEDVKTHLSAGKCFTIFRQWLAREGPFCIPEDGTLYENLVKPCADAYVSHGGELKCQATVRKVIVGQDKAKGVLVWEKEGREYLGKRIIVNCPFPSIPRLFEHLPPEVSDSIEELKKTWMVDVCTFSGLGKRITEEPRWVAAQDPKDWSFLLGIQAYSLVHPWSTPPGKHLIWTEKTYRLADYKSKEIRECLEESTRIAEQIFPGFTEAVEVQSHFVHPLLWHHQYSAYEKIPQESESVSGLYFVGDCTTPQYGTATDAAASSAVRVARGILGS